jgi:hypothetical protein
MSKIPNYEEIITGIKSAFNDRECLYPYERLMETTVDIIYDSPYCKKCGSIQIYRGICLDCQKNYFTAGKYVDLTKN